MGEVRLTPADNLFYKPLLEKLYEDVDLTARIRFNAARRCEFLNNLANWTVSLISLLLIALPVLQNIGVEPFNSTSKAQNATAIILAVFILVFSQFAIIENYSLRAFKYHDCAVRLNQLKRFMLPAIASPSKENYNEFVHKYNDVLRDYENHVDADYKLTLWMNMQKNIRKSIDNRESPPRYPRYFGLFYKQRILLLKAQLSYTARYYLAMLASLAMVVWSIYYR